MYINKQNVVFNLFYLIPTFHFLSVWLFESKLFIFFFVSAYIIYINPSLLRYSFPFWIQIFNGLLSFLSMFVVIYPLFWLKSLKSGHFSRFKPSLTNHKQVKVFGFLYIFICIWSLLPEINQVLTMRPSFYDKGPSEISWLLAGIFIAALYHRLYVLALLSALLLLYSGSRAPALAGFIFMIFNIISFASKSRFIGFLKTLALVSVSLIIFIGLPLLQGRELRLTDSASDAGRFESIDYFWNWLYQSDLYTILLGDGRDKFGSFGDMFGGASIGVESVILTDIGSFGLLGLLLWGILLFISLLKRDYLSLVLIVICAVSVSQYSFVGFFYFIGSYFIILSNSSARHSNT